MHMKTLEEDAIAELREAGKTHSRWLENIPDPARLNTCLIAYILFPLLKKIINAHSVFVTTNKVSIRTLFSTVTRNSSSYRP